MRSKITVDIKCNDLSNNLCYFKGKLHTTTISCFYNYSIKANQWVIVVVFVFVIVIIIVIDILILF